jgi:phospholipid/cholesterol/gamma-HCH transport system substrate-binding protein
VSRSILTRLVALLVVTALGVYYIAFDVVGVKLVHQPFTVKVDMPAAGGVYTDASVTYRGVEIGKVASLELYPKGVVAVLHIDHGAKVPANVQASVRELTAAAEQYLDLVPPAGAPVTTAFLQAGSTIPVSRTSIPVSVGTLLNNVNSLVDSLSARDLNTLSSALATGLQDAGGDLHSIIVNGDTLVSALQSAIPGTEELINAGHTVLSTFNSTSNEFEQFTANLDALSAQVKASNASLVGLLHNGAAASKAGDSFLKQYSSATVGLIDSLSASTGVAYARQHAFQALFQVLPLFSQDLSLVSEGGQLRFQVDFNTVDPVCPYNPTMAAPTAPRLAISTVLVTIADLTGDCTTEAPNLLQRGADKAPSP